MAEFIEPPWLTAKVDQLLALAKQELTEEAFGFDLIMLPLTEGHGPRWERTCDNCGVFVPDDQSFYSGTVSRKINDTQLVIAFGICFTCFTGEAP
jgi:hypothetical protein